ncbi:hypothetical protein IFR05_007290 [Cadophora sp. M221]|nr:hypothetical protein IFR05_007290 [Cadophora sp. M221]
MANHHQDASNKSGPSSNAEPKTYTSIPRVWPQGSSNPHTRISSSSPSSSSTNTNPQNQPTTTHRNPNLPTPMDRWLAEPTQESPFNTISSFENPPQGQGTHQAAEGGERGNGQGETHAEDTWSMDRNEQSERWA